MSLSDERQKRDLVVASSVLFLLFRRRREIHISTLVNSVYQRRVHKGDIFFWVQSQNEPDAHNEVV
jgi:hypothetical protein